MMWGSNVPVTRTPDAHWMAEARYRGQKVVVVAPDYADNAKFADEWLHPHPGTDGALAMGMGHVILKEFFVDRETPFFADYVRKFTDLPFLVTLTVRDGAYVPGKFLRAADLGQDGEGAQWKTVVLDAATGRAVVPNGSLGFRWTESGKGKSNLELGDIQPQLSLYDGEGAAGVEVLLPRFDTEGGEHGQGRGDVLRRGVPATRLGGADGPLVTTVFDLLLAQYGVFRHGLPGGWPASYEDDRTPGTPAWQEAHTSGPRDVTWRDEAPEGKLDLLLSLDFRQTSSTLLSDVVLPAATWYEKHDLSSTDMHPYVHSFSPAVDPPWQARTDFDTFKALAEKLSELAVGHLGVRKDLVASPLQHDTPGEIAQPGGVVLGWKRGDCDPVPGKTMPNLTVVERDYTAIGAKFAALGPLVEERGLPAKGIVLRPDEEVGRLRQLNGVGYQGRPSLDTAVKACDTILTLSGTTNGRLATQGFRTLEQRTGQEMAHLAAEREGKRVSYADTQATPVPVITSPEWSGSESGGRRYTAFTLNTEHLKPWHTLTGRQHFFLDHDWMEAARRSPVRALISTYRVALPLHPEYRTMPMVWYIPPLSPVVDALTETGHDGEDAQNLFGAIDTLRIPLEYLAELFTAGDTGPVRAALERLAAMRSHMRSVNLGEEPDARTAAAVGMAPEEVEAMYRLLAIAKYEERYVIPTTAVGDARRLEESALPEECSLDYEGGPGMGGDGRDGPFGQDSGRRRLPLVSVEIFHALRRRQTSDDSRET
jgi:nitrate reductase alpha subunit